MSQVIYQAGAAALAAAQDYCSPQDWERYCKDLPGEVMNLDQAVELIAQVDAQRYGKGIPCEVMRGDFNEALNCLPPERWECYEASESFRISERLCGALSTFYVRIGRRFWRVNDDHSSTHTHLVALCHNAA